MRRFFVFLISLVLLSSCSSKPAGPQTLAVMTHDSFAATDSVIQAFEQAHNAKINIIKSGDAGAALNKAILSKQAPLADMLYGVDNTFLSRALSADIYESYDAPALKSIPAEFQLDPTHRTLPVDSADVCIVYDKQYFSSRQLNAPTSLEDLTKPEYKGLLVVENPATSSPGLAFLLATIKHFGESNYIGFWKQLRQNGLQVVDGWETAYYTNFSGSSGKGAQPLVVSYATDPAAEIMFAPTPAPQESSVGAIIGPDTCFRQVEFVGILKGTKQRALAEQFVDFMLSAQFQADLPEQMFVFPVLPNVALPEAFTKYAQRPAQPASLPADLIAKNRDAWIQAWTKAVLK